MGLRLLKLARWAHGVTPAELPPDVIRRAALHHLSAAAAARVGAGPDPLARATGHAYDDFGPWGRATGAVVGAWSAAHGHRIDELLAATATGMEVAARIGTASLLRDVGRTEAVGRAIAVARLQELSEDETVDALAEALGDAPIDEGWRLDRALVGLGTGWRMRWTTFRLQPVAPALLTAVEGVAEILRRHVKAADKRLRVDQVERIEVRLDALAARRIAALAGRGIAEHPLDAATRPYALASVLGLLIATHEEGPGLLRLAAFRDHAEAVAAVAERVEVVVDPRLTVRRLRGTARALWPLLAGAAGPDAPHLPCPVSLRVFTTRGGVWPERREVIEGSPAYDLDTIERFVIEKHERCGGHMVIAREFLAAAADPTGPEGATAEEAVAMLAPGW